MPSWLFANNKSEMSLHDATRFNAAGSVTRLLDKGEDVNALDECGLACLHIAAEQGNVNIAQLLVRRNADVNIRDSAGSCPLHWAVMKCQREMIQLLVKEGADLHSRDKNGYNPLLLAAMFGDADNVKLLLSKGADVNSRDEAGCTALHSASARSDILMAQILLDKGANVGSPDKNGSTPLHAACGMAGHQSDLVRLLLARGAHPNAKDTSGRTPLHLAAHTNSTQAASALMSKGANIHSEDDHGRQPLHIACKSGSVDMVQLLCESGADVEAATKTGWTGMHYSCKLRHREIVNHLLEAGAAVNHSVIPQEGGSPLHLAVEQLDVLLAKQLIMHGADVNALDSVSWTPLHVAVSSSHEELVTMLLGHGADVNARTPEGETCLHISVGQHDNHIVKLLVANQNCDFNPVCKVKMVDGSIPAVVKNNISDDDTYEVEVTPTELAILLGEPQCVRSLLERGGVLTTDDFLPPHLAAVHNKVQALQVMIDVLHMDTTVTDKYGHTAMHWACIKGHKDIVMLLFLQEAELKGKFLEAMEASRSMAEDTISDDGSIASTSGHANGVDDVPPASPSNRISQPEWRPWLTLLDQTGATALHKSVQWGHSVITQCILDTMTGPTLVNVADQFGNTPLHYACMNGDVDAMKQLIFNGGYIDKVNDQGYTPLDLANYFGHKLPVDVLEKWNFESNDGSSSGSPRQA